MSDEASNTIRLGERTFTVLFPDLLRPLTQLEWTGLRDHIAQAGVIVPVVLDEEGGIIDGVHRLRAAAEAGLEEVPVVVRSGLTPQEKCNLAAALNERRRQLTPEDRQELVIKLRQQGLSTRAIGEKLGVGHMVVVRDLHEVEDRAELPSIITGRDGTRRPARRPQRPPAPRPAPATVATAPAPATDGLTVERLRQLLADVDPAAQVVLALDGEAHRVLLAEDIGPGRFEAGKFIPTNDRRRRNAVCVWPACET